MDTIYALASARGKAGVAVIRVSGGRAMQAVEALAGRVPPPRELRLRRLTVAGEVLDEALVAVFPAEASFTGEPVAEFHVHGGTAIVVAVLRALEAVPGLRPAEAGEFTRRAFLNGRLDLAQVEGLADLIDAETAAQRRQAMRVLSGAVARRVAQWRELLLRALALVEVTIDFADEDVPVDVRPEVGGLIDTLIGTLRSEVAGSAAAERLRDGFEVAIVGPPNAGKSTLINYLAGREVAIISPVPGTTRDVIEVRLDLDGLPVTLLDTAGLRHSDDAVERIGVERALERAKAADLRVFLYINQDDKKNAPIQPGDIVLRGRVDEAGPGVAGVSGLTGDGASALIARVRDELSTRVAGAGILTRARHRRAVLGALEALESAKGEVSGGMTRPELLAERLHAARRWLETLIGSIDTEAVLGEIFGRFCIGK
jgi:tRNA modification GTPase